MRRYIWFIFAFAVVFAAPTFSGVADVEAQDRGVKFFVVDWRLSWEEGTEGYRLVMKGRTRSKNGDLGESFVLETSETDLFIDVLRTCATGRLTGTATVEDHSSGTLVGQKVTSLSCRAILK
jgi:hypothetical protein